MNAARFALVLIALLALATWLPEEAAAQGLGRVGGNAVYGFNRSPIYGFNRPPIYGFNRPPVYGFNRPNYGVYPTMPYGWWGTYYTNPGYYLPYGHPEGVYYPYPVPGFWGYSGAYNVPSTTVPSAPRVPPPAVKNGKFDLPSGGATLSFPTLRTGKPRRRDRDRD